MENALVGQFRKLHITTSNDEDFKTNANSLLDQLISHAHETKDEKYEDEARQSMSEQVFTLPVWAFFISCHG